MARKIIEVGKRKEFLSGLLDTNNTQYVTKIAKTSTHNQ